MEFPEIFQSEYQFCLILWENEPITATALVNLCKNKLTWSKSTTYTVIKRLVSRGVIEKENSIYTSVISKQQAQTNLIKKLVLDYFGGSYCDFFKLVEQLSNARDE